MQIIGHRGAKGYAPENTLASFRKALTLKVDMIELDVYALRSGELIIMHDDTVDRTTNGEGYIWDYTFEELRKLDAGNGQKVPLLSEVLDLINKRCGVNIELKGQYTSGPLAKLLAEYINEKGWDKELFMVSSFNHQELTLFMDTFPSVHACALFDHNVMPKYGAFVRKRSAFAVNPDANVVTARMVRELHERGLKVFVWNVQTPSMAARMRRYKVDGIFTDYPDRIGQRQLRPKREQLIELFAGVVRS